jgi:uncharacterized OB-fold protein
MSLIKCKKCGSSNVKVDIETVYTSFPAKYGYKCQDCGEYGYINFDEVNMENFDKNGLQNVETEKNPNDTNKGGMLGWICPKCGRCYSPFTSMCSYCGNNGDIWRVTC